MKAVFLFFSYLRYTGVYIFSWLVCRLANIRLQLTYFIQLSLFSLIKFIRTLTFYSRIGFNIVYTSFVVSKNLFNSLSLLIEKIGLRFRKLSVLSIRNWLPIYKNLRKEIAFVELKRKRTLGLYQHLLYFKAVR